MARSGSNADAWDYTWLQTDDNLNDFIKRVGRKDLGHTGLSKSGVNLIAFESRFRTTCRARENVR